MFLTQGISGKVMSKAYTSLKKVKWVGKSQFIIHKRELLESMAWKSLNLNERRLIDFLELCLLDTAGENNGDLIATYRQIEKYGGIDRHFIKNTINTLIEKGLLKVKISDTVGKYGKYTYCFCLTYLPSSFMENNKKVFLEPSNEWLRYNPISYP